MKVQLQGQSLRLRISELELQQLQAGEEIGNLTKLPGGITYSFHIGLVEVDLPSLEGGPSCWWLNFPRHALAQYVERLPCRDALRISLAIGQETVLGVDFEVDVRDSVRHRGAQRHR